MKVKVIVSMRKLYKFTGDGIAISYLVDSLQKEPVINVTIGSHIAHDGDVFDLALELSQSKELHELLGALLKEVEDA